MPLVKVRVTANRVYYCSDRHEEIDPKTRKVIRGKDGKPVLYRNHYLRNEGEVIEVDTDDLAPIEKRIKGAQDDSYEIVVGKKTWLCDWGVQVSESEAISEPAGNQRTFVSDVIKVPAGVL